MGTWTTILFIAGYGVLDFQLKLVYPLSLCSLVALASCSVVLGVIIGFLDYIL